jgi:hypothetical protein
MQDHPTEPTPPERARTAVARARVATLVTKGCAVRPGTLTVVAMEDQPDGRPVIHLEGSSPTVRELGACRVATLSVASPAPFRSLELTGPLRPCRGTRPGHRTYRLSPLTVRLVGRTSHSLHVSDYHAAQPDPLAGLATEFLHHLADAHASDLLAWIRAQGYENAEAVLPRGVDRYGIELAVLGTAGVQRARLTFPDGPIENLEQAPQGLLVPLSCRCRGTGSRDA